MRAIAAPPRAFEKARPAGGRRARRGARRGAAGSSRARGEGAPARAATPPSLLAPPVVITIGPACHDVDTLAALLEAGATAARCDLTWGPLGFHRAALANLNAAMARTRRLCAVLLDTSGREIYVDRSTALAVDASGWPVHGVDVDVAAGDTVRLVCGATAPSRRGAPTPPPAGAAADSTVPSIVTLDVSYGGLAAMAAAGDTIVVGRYLATGSEETSVYLTATAVDGDTITATAANAASLGGLLTVFHCERAAAGLANAQNDLPALCGEDREAIAALVAEYEVDFVSLSFTRSVADVAECRDFLDGLPDGGGTATRILAKLETRQSLLEFDAILDAADGVILSRGNLGLDAPPEKMALIQKAAAAAANRAGKPILMTRVVDTMVTAPRPTRAEATDVANAVLDGVDAILLGAETLRGKHPVATVATVLAICRQAEAVFDHAGHFDRVMLDAVAADEGWSPDAVAALGLARGASSASLDAEPLTPSGSFPRLASRGAALGAAPSSGGLSTGSPPYLSRLEAVASSAVRAAAKVRAALILVYTQSGQAAQLVAKYRPPTPIVALVIPRLSSDGMTWRLEGRSVARQSLIVRGLLPVLAAPAPSSESLLEESIVMASTFGLVAPGDHVVVVQMMRDSFAIKIVTGERGARRRGGVVAVFRAPFRRPPTPRAPPPVSSRRRRFLHRQDSPQIPARPHEGDRGRVGHDGDARRRLRPRRGDRRRRRQAPPAPRVWVGRRRAGGTDVHGVHDGAVVDVRGDGGGGGRVRGVDEARAREGAAPRVSFFSLQSSPLDLVRQRGPHAVVVAAVVVRHRERDGGARGAARRRGRLLFTIPFLALLALIVVCERPVGGIHQGGQQGVARRRPPRCFNRRAQRRRQPRPRRRAAPHFRQRARRKRERGEQVAVGGGEEVARRESRAQRRERAPRRGRRQPAGELGRQFGRLATRGRGGGVGQGRRVRHHDERRQRQRGRRAARERHAPHARRRAGLGQGRNGQAVRFPGGGPQGGQGGEGRPKAAVVGDNEKGVRTLALDASEGVGQQAREPHRPLGHDERNARVDAAAREVRRAPVDRRARRADGDERGGGAGAGQPRSERARQAGCGAGRGERRRPPLHTLDPHRHPSLHQRRHQVQARVDCGPRGRRVHARDEVAGDARAALGRRGLAPRRAVGHGDAGVEGFRHRVRAPRGFGVAALRGRERERPRVERGGARREQRGSHSRDRRGLRARGVVAALCGLLAAGACVGQRDAVVGD